jgi:hypothetical protein
MKRLLAILAPLLFAATAAAGNWTGCGESDPDSVELGCRVDSDCYEAGEPQRWCQTETGICVAFTSPPGETWEPDGGAP